MKANRFTPTIAFLLLIAVSLAGCIGADTGETSTAGDGDAGASDGGNQTADGGNGTVDQGDAEGPSGGPLAKIQVSGENVTANGSSYEFSENVTVTLDASNSTDPAGGNLSFAWDFGGDVMADGPVVSMNFTAGNHTVDLTATSDASGLSSTARATLRVLEVEGDVVELEPQTFSADVLAPCPQCYFVGRDASVSYTSGEDGIDSAWIEFGPGLDGLPFTASGPTDADIFFHATCGGEEIEGFDNTGNEAGVVPAGATCAWVYEFESPGTIELVIG